MPENIAKNTAYSDAVPPFATDQSRWPIDKVILSDFKASGKSSLTSENATVQSINGWLSVYALVKVMRDSGATDVTRATVKQAFDQAKDIPMFNLMPPWTPSKQSTNAIFKGILDKLKEVELTEEELKQLDENQEMLELARAAILGRMNGKAAGGPPGGRRSMRENPTRSVDARQKGEPNPAGQ